jgi:MOSC domain-containing protein YiiM
MVSRKSKFPGVNAYIITEIGQGKCRIFKVLPKRTEEQMSASVHSIFYQENPSEFKEPYRFSRIPTDKAQLIAGYGIEGDLKAGKAAKRHLNIMSLETLESLREQGYQVESGQMGQQLVLSGVNMADLPSGTRLQIGPSAVVRVNMRRSGCEWFETVQEGRTRAVDLGVMASVIETGPIQIGDAVTVLPGLDTEDEPAHTPQANETV